MKFHLQNIDFVKLIIGYAMKTQMNVKMYPMFALLLIVISFHCTAQENKTPTITKTFDLNQAGKLNAKSSGGGIDVKVHDQKTVEVQAFVRKNNQVLAPNDPQVRTILEDFDLDIEKNGSVITANVERKSRFNLRNNNVGIALTIIVPREMSCNVSSSGGGLRISGVTGTHNFSSSGGGIYLENITGTTEAKSSGGGVEVINQKGDIQLSSSGGGVTLNEAHGKVAASSSGGGVDLTNIHGDVDASSTGGGVKVTGESGSVKAKSSGGSVHVNIDKLSHELSLESSGGGIDAVIRNGDKLGLDLDLSSDKVNIDLHNFSGKSEKNRVKGTMNNGGIPVFMRSSGGNVTVRFDN